MVRFASYISNLGRVQLVNGMNAINEQLNRGQQFPLRILYTDTDSIYIDCYDRFMREIALKQESGEDCTDTINRLTTWQQISDSLLSDSLKIEAERETLQFVE